MESKRPNNLDPKHQWKPGQSGNPKGRPKTPAISLLRKAMGEVELEKRKSFFKHVVERAYKSDVVAVAIMRKIVPDIQDLKVEGQMTLKDIMSTMIHGATESGDDDDV